MAHDRPPNRLPALATVLGGLTLIVAGLGMAGLLPDAEPVVAVATPSPAPSAAPSPSPSAAPTSSPSSSSAPTPTPRTALATRVTIPRLRIDLPVIEANEGYPLCGVAMYHPLLGQPGQGRAIYLSAHARRGMFGPIYDRVIARRDPDSLLGMHVFVWASDGLRFEYVIDEVRTKQTSVYEALVAKDEQLWLQTPEGPRGTVGVTQVIALPVGTGPVPDAADASPSPRPRACR